MHKVIAMHWFCLAIAVAANVATNLLLKKTMNSADAPFGVELARQVVFSPWLWASLVAGGLLLASYLLAIRTLDLSLSYAIVTCTALLSITIFSSFFFGESLTVLKITGILLIISGIVLITS